MLDHTTMLLWHQREEGGGLESRGEHENIREKALPPLRYFCFQGQQRPWLSSFSLLS